MAQSSSRPLYGTDAFRAAAGGTLRPGGLELTAYGLERMAELGLAPGASVLDLGCGPGATAAFLAENGFDAVGIDWHPGPGETGEASSFTGSPSLVEGDILALPFADFSFDACVAECVLSLVEDLGKALSESFRVLKPGGLLLVADLTLREQAAPPLALSSPFLTHGQSCLAGALLPQTWTKALQVAGFTVTHAEDVSHVLAAFMAKLVWCGCADDLSWLLPGREDGGAVCAKEARKRYGYGLFLARKNA